MVYNLKPGNRIFFYYFSWDGKIASIENQNILFHQGKSSTLYKLYYYIVQMSKMKAILLTMRSRRRLVLYFENNY